MTRNEKKIERLKCNLENWMLVIDDICGGSGIPSAFVGETKARIQDEICKMIHELWTRDHVMRL